MHCAGLSTSETLAAQQVFMDPDSTKASPSTVAELSEEASLPESASALAHETGGDETTEAPESNSNTESQEAEHPAEEGCREPLLKWERPMTFR